MKFTQMYQTMRSASSQRTKTLQVPGIPPPIASSMGLGRSVTKGPTIAIVPALSGLKA